MDNNKDNKEDIKKKSGQFYTQNKKKIITLIILFFLSLGTYYYFQDLKQKKNNLISEKYLQAGLFLASNKKEGSTKLLEEVILSKNKFYAILALNTILEKQLITDSTKILEYFEILENLKIDDEKRDLIIFKKALYLYDISSIEEGEKLLKRLIESNSKLAFLAKEILDK